MAAAGVKLNFGAVRMAMIANIRPGDRVTILILNGIDRNGQEWKEATGRAVICSGDYVVLNMGGCYGTPRVATANDVVQVNSRKDARQ